MKILKILAKHGLILVFFMLVLFCAVSLSQMAAILNKTPAQPFAKDL